MPKTSNKEILEQISQSLKQINDSLAILTMSKVCDHVKLMPTKDNKITCRYCGVQINKD